LLERWFLAGGALPKGASINFQVVYASYNMVSLINKFTNKCTCFYRLFKIRELETKKIT